MSFATNPIRTLIDDFLSNKKAIVPALYIGAGVILGIGGKTILDGPRNQYYPVQSTQTNNPQVVINLNINPVDLVTKVESYLSNPEMVKQSLSEEKIRTYAQSLAYIANASEIGAGAISELMHDRDFKIILGTRYDAFVDEFKKNYIEKTIPGELSERQFLKKYRSGKQPTSKRKLNFSE